MDLSRLEFTHFAHSLVWKFEATGELEEVVALLVDEERIARTRILGYVERVRHCWKQQNLQSSMSWYSLRPTNELPAECHVSATQTMHTLTKRKRNTAEFIASLLDLFSSSSSASLLEEAEESSDTSDHSSDISTKNKETSRISSVSSEEAEENKETHPWSGRSTTGTSRDANLVSGVSR